MGLSQRVALTGGSSFTAYCIGRAFAQAGWETHVLCPRNATEAYFGLKKYRVSELSKVCKVHFGVRAEDDSMARWAEEFKPRIWIQHHHWMEDYRQKTYDEAKALAWGIEPLDRLLSALRSNSAFSGMIYSGTCFEPQYLGKDPKDVTPYARSKQLVWEALEQKCQSQKLLLSKVVITDPVGPGENADRLIPIMLRNSFTRQPQRIVGPHTVYDRIPGEVLAQAYLRAAQLLLLGEPRVERPSGAVTELETWIMRVHDELIIKRLHWPPLHFNIESPEIVSRSQNTDPEAIDWPQFWDQYARWIADNPSLVLETQA